MAVDSLVSYEREGPVAVLGLDDGKANVLTPRMLAALNAALDRAEAERAIVLILGRPGVFSGGFDLKLLRSGRFAALRMLRTGFRLSARLLAFPYPVVVGCTGHAIAMGSFLALSADYRIGAAGDFKIQANEVVIGLTMPRAAVAICRQRLAPAHFVRAMVHAEAFDPEGAAAAGFLDRVVAPEDVRAEALRYAQSLTELDLTAHARTKLRIRARVLRDIRRGLAADLRELTLLGLRRMVRARLGRKTERAGRGGADSSSG